MVTRSGMRKPGLRKGGVDASAGSTAGSASVMLAAGRCLDLARVTTDRLEGDAARARAVALGRVISNSLCDRKSAASLLNEGGGRCAVSRPVTRNRQTFRSPRTARRKASTPAHAISRAKEKRRHRAMGAGAPCDYELLNPAAECAAAQGSCYSPMQRVKTARHGSQPISRIWRIVVLKDGFVIPLRESDDFHC